jgi:hypothetical protein
MTDAIEWLKNSRYQTRETVVAFAVYEIESLRQQLVNDQRELTLGDTREFILKQRLAECQASIKQAKREAYLRAAEYCRSLWRGSEEKYQLYENDVEDGIRRMAEELK